MPFWFFLDQIRFGPAGRFRPFGPKRSQRQRRRQRRRMG